MSDGPPLRHIDVSPVAALVGLVVVTAVAASFVLGADGPADVVVGIAVLAAPVVAVAVRRRRRP